MREVRYDISNLPDNLEKFLLEIEKDPSLVIIFTKDSEDELVLVGVDFYNMLTGKDNHNGSALDDGSL